MNRTQNEPDAGPETGCRTGDRISGQLEWPMTSGQWSNFMMDNICLI